MGPVVRKGVTPLRTAAPNRPRLLAQQAVCGLQFRRRVKLRCLWLTLVAACGFTAPTPEGPTDYPGATPPVTGTPRHCSTTDPALRLCIDFDDADALTGDGSGLHHDAASTDLSVMERENEQAAMLSATTRLTVAETPDLDITNNLSVTLWARPDHRPVITQSYWMLDNNRQYYASYQSDGRFRCGIGNMVVDTALPLDPGTWYHVACTYDQAQESLRIYVDGSVAGCREIDSAIPTNGAEGLAIGSNLGPGPTYTMPFIGGLDNIEVFARTMTPDQICAASGSDSCTDICP